MTGNQPAIRRYITLSQLSDKLGGRSRTGIYNDIKAGRLPKPKKLGNRLYFDDDEVDDAMAERDAA